MDVSLRDLGCLRPQLRKLELHCCSMSGAAAFFAHSWPRLEVLLLAVCTIDADFGAVALPSLECLELTQVEMGGELYDCAGLFGPGCPKVTHLGFGPKLRGAASSPKTSCKGFGSPAER